MFSSPGDSQVLRQLSSAQLGRDVSELRRALEKYHPGLYWYTSKDEFNSTWDSLSARLEHPMGEIEFIKLLLPVIAKVKCAHTLFYPSPDIIARGTRFPLDLKFIDGKGYIMIGAENQYQIPNGSELLTVNGNLLNEIVELMLPGVMAQGGNVGWKYVVLENDFQNFYYYIVEQTDRFEIEYINRLTGEKTSTTINGSSEPFLRNHWKKWYPISDGAPLTIRYLTDPAVAVITIKSLSKGRYKAYKQDFDELIDQYFEEISKKGLRNLIIDVRGNEGGNNPEKLYSYIARDGEYNTDSPGNASIIVPAKKNNFQGRVIVLANQRTISAQETFVSIFQNNKRGLTVGESTAGCYKGLCGGKKHRLRLPNSRHEIRIPLHPSFRTYKGSVNYAEGQGLPPDLEVAEDIDALLGGRDLAMEVALKKIEDGS